MRVHTLNYHPDHPTAPATEDGNHICLQLFEGSKIHESITVRLEPARVAQPEALSKVTFTSYGKGASIGFAIPEDWTECAVVALHYTNMVVVLCTKPSLANGPALFQKVLTATNQRKLSTLPPFYAMPLTENHNRKPAGLRQLQAA